jgi:hypothetical protein
VETWEWRKIENRHKRKERKEKQHENTKEITSSRILTGHFQWSYKCTQRNTRLKPTDNTDKCSIRRKKRNIRKTYGYYLLQLTALVYVEIKVIPTGLG